MATVGPVRSRRSYCWEAAAPNSTPVWNTRLYTRMEYQTEKTNGASDSAPQRNTRTVKFTRTMKYTRVEHQTENVQSRAILKMLQQAFNRQRNSRSDQYTCPAAAE